MDKESNTPGPHRKDWANKLDPTVDSGHGARAARQDPTQTETGPYQTDAVGIQANATDDMEVVQGQRGSHSEHRQGAAAAAAAASGPGPAPTTAGPHSKDILNKLDPRVDSQQTPMKMQGDASKHDQDRTGQAASQNSSSRQSAPAPAPGPNDGHAQMGYHENMNLKESREAMS